MGRPGHPMFMFPEWPASLGQPQFHVYPFVKKLEMLIFGWQNIFSGDALMNLLNSSYAFNYPALQSFSLEIKNYTFRVDINAEDVFVMAKQLNSFSLMVKQMALKAKKVRVVWKNVLYSPKAEQVGEALNQALSVLLSGAADIGFKEDSSAIFTMVPPTQFSDITHFTYDVSPGHSWPFEFIRRRSDVLKALHLTGLEREHTVELLYDMNVRPVVYSMLEELSIGGATSMFGGQRALAPREMPMGPGRMIRFPKLRRIKMTSAYMFEDDVLFTGSGQTLEHLDIFVDIKFVELAEKHGIFAQDRFLRMEYMSVNTWGFVDRTRQGELRRDSFIKAVMNSVSKLAPSFSGFKFTGGCDKAMLHWNVLRAFQHTTIRSLDLLMLEFSLSDITELLRSMPQLYILSCTASSEVPEIKGLRRADMIEYMRSTYPMSEHFHTLKIYWRDASLTEQIAALGLYLAIACRQFVRIVSNGVSRQSFENALGTLRYLSPFAEYEELTKCLVAG
ncbi:hypothetical protein GGI07_002103 [Coemansia sp. Benny D115]|nr:hypothetical protein GGI07_002103 [Coemansia sp. Benny D115]